MNGWTCSFARMMRSWNNGRPVNKKSSNCTMNWQSEKDNVTSKTTSLHNKKCSTSLKPIVKSIVNATTQELNETRDHVSLMQQELNSTIDRKTSTERELKNCMDDLTAANIENDNLNAEIKRCSMEMKGQQGKIVDLKRCGIWLRGVHGSCNIRDLIKRM